MFVIMNVQAYSRSRPTSTIRLLVPWVVIVVLLAETRGRLAMSVVLFAQYLGKTLTAAPVSIRYLQLLRLSATYNNLEGDKVGRVASTKSCRVSVISTDARVATLLWPTRLKKSARVSARACFITECLMIIEDRCISCVDRLNSTFLLCIRWRNVRTASLLNV